MRTPRDRSAVLLALGLAAAGAATAHGLAYRIAGPDAEHRDRLLANMGHAYLDPALLGSLVAALVIVGFTARLFAGPGHAGRPPSWLFALAPPAGFTVQEHAERLLHNDALLTTVAEPTFLVGLALQLPFAIVALLAARALLAAAGALARHVGSPPRSPRLASEASLATPGTCWIPSVPTLVGARGQRAPPSSPPR